VQLVSWLSSAPAVHWQACGWCCGAPGAVAISGAQGVHAAAPRALQLLVGHGRCVRFLGQAWPAAHATQPQAAPTPRPTKLVVQMQTQTRARPSRCAQSGLGTRRSPACSITFCQASRGQGTQARRATPSAKLPAAHARHTSGNVALSATA